MLNKLNIQQQNQQLLLAIADVLIHSYSGQAMFDDLTSTKEARQKLAKIVNNIRNIK